MTLVSVVIPSYNREGTLQEAIQSVQRQTFGEFEVVVVDDGSTDGTEAAVSRIAQDDGRIGYVRKPNGGVASARNRGIAESRPLRYVAFLDSDDVWMPTHLERSIAVLEAYPDVALAFGRRVYSDISGLLSRDDSISAFDREFANIRSQATSAGKRGTYFLGAAVCRDALLRSQFAPWTSSVVVRRANVCDEEWFDPHLEVLEDVDFFLKLSTHPFALIDEVAGSYRYFGDNLTAARDLASPVTLRRQKAVLAFQRKKLARCRTEDEIRFVRTEMAGTAYLIGQCCSEQGELKSALAAYFESLQFRASWRSVRGLGRTLLVGAQRGGQRAIGCDAGRQTRG